ncbi:MAG: osmoprotectant NAGGN system M42 family peptidase [Rhodospirillaceae bacterium]
MRRLPIDKDYMLRILARLLDTPSPSGMTDAITHVVCEELEALGISYELTRRGAIRANLPGVRYSPDRAIIAHLDTLGAMVKRLKDDGRLEIVPVGYWSSRMAEGTRVTIYSDKNTQHRGTILPIKASGHVFNEEIDALEVSWRTVEVRVDAPVSSKQDLIDLGINVGDHLSIDPNPEFLDNGFIVSRHLDDKCGVAAALAAACAIHEADVRVPVDCHILFTISEEVGVGASAVLHGDVAEMVSIDNGTIAPEQNTSEYGVTLAMQDMSGPFDWHLTRRLIDLCQRHNIEHSRDVFRYYRSDAAAAVEAGNDIRTALICFACDASHGYERTHVDSIVALAELLALYIQSDPVFKRDKRKLGSIEDFPDPALQGGEKGRLDPR